LEALEAADSGSNIGFNYSHLKKQDKESLTEDVNENKNQNCFIYRLILAIACTMVIVHQSSIPPPWVGVTLKTQQISEVGGLDPST
jgi:hypothetical protein